MNDIYAIQNAIPVLNAELRRIYGIGLMTDQLLCLADSTRWEEALDMLDDMQARLGIADTVRAQVEDAINYRQIKIEEKA